MNFFFFFFFLLELSQYKTSSALVRKICNNSTYNSAYNSRDLANNKKEKRGAENSDLDAVTQRKNWTKSKLITLRAKTPATNNAV